MVGGARDPDAHRAGSLNVRYRRLTLVFFASTRGRRRRSPPLCRPILLLCNATCSTLRFKVFNEGLRDEQGEHDGGVRVDLHRRRLRSDLPPAHGLVRLGPAVAPVEFLRRVDGHRKVRAVSHEVGVVDVVLGHAAAQDDHARLLGPAHGPRLVVHRPDILHQVHHQPGVLETVKVEHVADAPVGERWAVHRDVHLRRPVIHALLVVDLQTEPVDDLTRGPHHALRVLLLLHNVQHGHDPVLELAVVVVGHQQVADAVEALLTKFGTLEREIPEVGWRQTLDEVFLDAARGGDQHVDHFVLDEVPELLADAAGDEVRRESQENFGPGRGAVRRVPLVLVGRIVDGLVAEAPLEHPVHLVHAPPELGRLVPRGHHAIQHLLKVERALEVVPAHRGGSLRHLHGL